mgnify:CR=1 FL=1
MNKKPSCEELEQRVKELEKEASLRRKAEMATKESQERLAQIVEGSPIPTFVIDKRHIITHCNRAYENLTGISTEDIMGTDKQWMAFYPKKRPVMADFIVDGTSETEMKRYYPGKCRKSAVTRGGYEAEDFFPNLGDKGKWLFFTASPLRDGNGSITGAIETLQDMTERKKAEQGLRESERRLRTLLDFMPYPIVVFRLDGKVYYLNPAFTQTFGWFLDELEGRHIPYVPPNLHQETRDNIKKLFEDKVIGRHETKRLTKDGRVLDVVMTAAVYSESEDEPAGEVVLLRDITQEKRIARNNEAILKISMALPEYPDLEELLDYVSGEVKRQMNSEGALVILHDEENEELFFKGAAYDDPSIEARVKDIRFPIDRLVAGKVVKTGKPIIISDPSRDPELSRERDEKLGYHTRNLVLVPLRSSDRIIGVLCAINKKEGQFEESEVESLNMIAGTVVLSIENARFADEVKKAYREVSSLNRAKDKVISHLSHELKTPVAVLSGSLNILARRLSVVPGESWERTMQRARRNLDRITEIQNAAEDIMHDKQYKTYTLLSQTLDRCRDELEVLFAEELDEGPVIEKVRERIEDLFGPREIIPMEIRLEEYVKTRIEELRPLFSHRELIIETDIQPAPPVFIPPTVLQKAFDGIFRNAVENTPDEGCIEIRVHERDGGAELVIHDYGVGIRSEDQRHIFEGFFATQETMSYSSKRPFDFNAGGKGADLLRIRIFSERYNFKVEMTSSRCRFLWKEDAVCPGRISECKNCSQGGDCSRLGQTVFRLHFPPAPQSGVSPARND